MKHNLGISTVAIVCVLCTAVSGAYGASSVRSLGGSGTYTSASNAAAAADSNGSASSIRGGSVRVNPTSGVSGTSTTIEAGTTTSGRVATTPRLSIGHYLGGATSVSGGSSLRPTTPSGGTSGGGSTGGGVSGDDFAGLQGRVDQLERDYNDLQGVTDGLTDQIATKQDVLVPGNNGYIIIDNNEIFVDVDALEGALETVAGKDGREVELGSNDTHLLWRYVGEGNDGWHELIAKADITGPQGEKGEKGDPGDAANLDAYSTTEQMNAAISAAIAGLATTYATKAELAGYATSEDLTRGLQNTESKFYPKEQTYTKTEVDQSIAAAIAGDSSALDAKADKTYVDEQLATKADKSALISVEQLAGSAAATATAASSAAAQASTDATNALAGLANKEDKSNKKTTLTNSDTDYPSTSAVTAALAGKADVSALDDYVTNDGLATAVDGALDTAGVVTDANMSEKLADYATKSDLSGYATTDALNAKADKATTLAGYGITDTYTSAEIDDKLEAVTVGGMEGMEEILAGKQDVANMAQTVTDDETKYPSSAAVYGELETKANASDLANYATTETVNQITEDVTNVTQTVTQLGDTINNAETGLKKQVEDAVTTANTAKEAADAAASAVAGKQDALGFTPENVANKSSTVVDDESKYPSSAAVYGELETKANVSDLANYATTANLNAKQDKKMGVGHENHIVTTDETGTITSVAAIEQSAVNGLTDALDAKADASALDDYVTNDGLATAVDGALDTAGVVTEESLATKGFVTETQLNEKDYVTNSELATKGYATTADLDGKQDALGYTAENEANKTDDMTVDAGSTTKYPTVHAVEAYVTNTVAEGVDINTDQIDDGAITKPKLHQNLQAEIDGKANTADLGALAKRDQITNADVADDAAIAKSKLALDVQTALDNAANAVAAPDGEKPANSILGTDGDGNPTWYEIVLE